MQIHTRLAALTGGETLFVLAAAPGDERAVFGGLIAAECRRGRPPFVAVLTDGSAAGDPDRLEGEVRQAAAALGVPGDWLRMLGLRDGTACAGDVVFQAVVGSVVHLMWRYDCNLIVTTADPVCAAVAAAVAERSGVGLLAYSAVLDALDCFVPRGDD